MTLIIDISLPVSESSPVYPGNLQPQFKKIIKPSGSELTHITIDSHMGTHIDAPSHAGLNNGTSSDFSLSAFYGECRVIELLDTNLIEPHHFEAFNIQSGERILFKTNNSIRGFDEFYETWTALSAESARYLAEKEVALVGIDWFGIKQKNAPTNEAHTALLEKNIPILEGIDLNNVAPGAYTLSAFPVAYQGLDGAPARAVLIQ